MARFQNLMEILKILPKTNCRQCDEKTCMAFAAAVFKGEKALSMCPFVDPGVAAENEAPARKVNGPEQDMDKALQAMKKQIQAANLSAAAQRTGGWHNGNKLTLKIMGKDFSIDAAGNLVTDIHVNPWVALPILNYILHCKGTPVANQWVSMRELPSGKDWHHFFTHQCETPFKKLADSYTDRKSVV